MARKKKHEEHENLERWLVSYADFITLLFAFFVVLYATSQTDQEKLEAVINGMNAAFEGGMPHALLDLMAVERPPEVPELVPNHLTAESANPLIQTIRRNLAGSLSDNVVQIGLVDQTLTLVLPERLLFAKGRADLHPSAYSMLGEVALALGPHPVAVDVLGHADGLPVVGPPFEDNWGLATARALSVVRYLHRRGMPKESMQPSGSVVGEEDAQARAVTLRIRVVEPGASAEVADALEPEARRDAAAAAERAGVDMPERIPVPLELTPETPLNPSRPSASPATPAPPAAAAPATAAPAAPAPAAPTPAVPANPPGSSTASPTVAPPP